jgi:hypothetical protein
MMLFNQPEWLILARLRKMSSPEIKDAVAHNTSKNIAL